MPEPLVSICTSEHCFDVQFHPRSPLVAAALVTGEVELWRYTLPTEPDEQEEGEEEGRGEAPLAEATEGSAELVRTLRIHKKSCRTARFLPSNAQPDSEQPGDVGGASSSDSANLLSTGPDCLALVTDVETGSRVWRCKLAAGGNAVYPMGGTRFAVGGDTGSIRIFDLRLPKSVLQYNENEDFITDMALHHNEYNLCATAGDGTLAVYDLRKNGTPGLEAMSDFQEDEFLSCCIFRNGKTVACGSQTGVIALFQWGDFGDQQERLKGHPTSVDAMVKFSEDCAITGCSDGKIRVAAVRHVEYGNRVLGFLGDHSDYPVEQLALSPDKELIASASHGQPTVRIWSTDIVHSILDGKSDVEAADEADGAADKDSSSDEDSAPRTRKKRKMRKPSLEAFKAKQFFSDL